MKQIKIKRKAKKKNSFLQKPKTRNTQCFTMNNNACFPAYIEHKGVISSAIEKSTYFYVYIVLRAKDFICRHSYRVLYEKVKNNIFLTKLQEKTTTAIYIYIVDISYINK